MVISRHALRNALIPTITVIGLQFANLLSGVVIIEWLFAWPGMGWLTVDAVQNRDYSVVQASVILMATGFVLVNLVVDLLYAVFDPRIRYRDQDGAWVVRGGVNGAVVTRVQGEIAVLKLGRTDVERASRGFFRGDRGWLLQASHLGRGRRDSGRDCPRCRLRAAHQPLCRRRG